jgi:hypothetical protein
MFSRASAELAARPTPRPERRGDDLPAVILLCKALRVWIAAHADLTRSPRAAVAALLEARRLGDLAGICDRLFAAAVLAVGRDLVTGCGCTMSADEAWLAWAAGLQREGGPGPRIDGPARANFAAAASEARTLWRLARSGS